MRKIKEEKSELFFIDSKLSSSPVNSSSNIRSKICKGFLFCVFLVLFFHVSGVIHKKLFPEIEKVTSTATYQSIAVRGMLKCNGKAASHVLVKLYDHDTFTFDDKIASARTDSAGHFEISGSGREISRVTPIFNIYHDCMDYKPCQRKISLTSPKSYLTAGKEAKKVYDAGTIELARSFPGEGRDCIH